MNQPAFSPGSLVRARGREWMVLPGTDHETLRVRPVSGSEEDQTFIYMPLEAEPVVPASFPLPNLEQRAGHEAALLLRDALVLSLRRGGGPFRSFGQISVEPRAYQLVPLLMALKLDPVRLLIADDVGIGKTIEAGLIARELLDRGDIQRMTVLCPPHLVEQWERELENHFHIHAAAVTAASAARLERGLPPSESIFSAYPHTVVSLDYIKSEKRRNDFLRACPELVLVDEAHSCVGVGERKQLRYRLLQGLAESATRHLVMLTATPHSGDELAFYRLLGLLDPRFEALGAAEGAQREDLRETLSKHFVQRRRPDIAEWKEGHLFPRRETKELTYRLTGTWEKLFDDVLGYCATVVEAAGTDERRRRLNFWGTLALMRCVSSSPAAAAQALRTRTQAAQTAEEEENLADLVFDGTPEALSADDVEPAAPAEDPALAALIEQAEQLKTKADDPKLKLLTKHIGELLGDGFRPVVFCRYIATAKYVGERLAKEFSDVSVGVVTGEFSSEEREEQIEALADAEKYLLVATDCLSEGINLQEHFDAVVHYDLSWNPTRHQQREGRVDRFGQERPVVRATLIYGENNAVDGAVLQVILRKAEKIRADLGVPVPLPDDEHKLTQALMRAVMLRGNRSMRQQTFNFAETPEGKEIEAVWEDASEKAKRNRTIFAQSRLKPDDVLPEWKRTREVIGGGDEVRRFVDRALSRLGAGLEPMKTGFKAPLGSLPEDVRDRLDAEGLSGNVRVAFQYPPPHRCRSVLRSHPLVSVLAETLLERTLANEENPDSDPAILGRVGCWTSAEVEAQTTVVLLRLRHQLTSQVSGRTTTLLVEEASALAWRGRAGSEVADGTDALQLLLAPPAGDPPGAVRERIAGQALRMIEDRSDDLEKFAASRADALLGDHRRVREAAQARGSYSVKTLLPPDVIGVFVLLPRVA